MTASMTVLIAPVKSPEKRQAAEAMSERQMMEASAEHIYGKIFCERYTDAILPGTGAEHAQWVEVLQAVATERGLGFAYNDGFKLALERLRATTGA